jgi:hypothetical protein
MAGLEKGAATIERAFKWFGFKVRELFSVLLISLNSYPARQKSVSKALGEDIIVQ